MKLKLFASALCLVMGLSLSAQTPSKNSKDKTPKQYPSEQMIKELNLTPKQVSEMKAFQEEQKAQREKFREEQQKMTPEQKADTAARKAALEKRRDENRAKMKQILTADQYTKYLEMRLDQKQKMDKRRKDGKCNKKGNQERKENRRPTQPAETK